mmetsp:Transcript_16824/g.38748  ORF Transcript_16824/g.38748 Transcript_16824/m.38748 type:complete len:269 (+) Transcript_16824:470-1276(+)
MLTKLGWRVEDLGDLDFTAATTTSSLTQDNAKNCGFVGNACSKLADIVQSTLLHDKFPLILGGDHSIAWGTLSGILRVRPNTGVLWVDAHADLNTPETTQTGNLHGMPIGLLLQGMAPSTNREGWSARNGPRLSPSSIVYVGLRDVDIPERQCIRQYGIQAFTMHELDRYGIGKVMEMALDHLDGKPLHLSYDIDAVDPLLAPATGTTVRGGLTFREAHYIAEATAMSGQLASAEIVELNPTLGDDGAKETIDLGLQLVTSMMGKSII